MIRTLVQLMLLSVLASAGVHWTYKELEKQVIQPPWFPQLDSIQGKESTELEEFVAELDEKTLQQGGTESRIILQRNVFQVGLAPKPLAPPPPPQQEVQAVVEEPAQPTSLNLNLVGTLIRSQEHSMAIIVDAQKRGEQQLLRIGDGIQGAIVQAIEWDKVTLDVNGKLEILEMPKPQASAASTPASRPQARRLPPSPPPPPPPAPDLSDHPRALEEMRPRRPPPLRPQRRIDLPSPESDSLAPREGSVPLDGIALPPIE
jgi:hypothetical protein